MFNEPKFSHGNRGAVRKLRHHAPNRLGDGDWEGDTVAGITGKACTVTLVDRKSRYLLDGKADDKKTDPVNIVMIQKAL
jgi:IS30 family transposase